MEAGRAEARAETALVQPQRAAEAWQDTPRADAIDAAFTGAVHALEDRQVDFDLLDEGALDADPALRLHAQTRNGQLVVGRQSYRIAVLPETPTLAIGTVRTLQRLVRGGGTVVAFGELPAEEAAGDDAGLRRALDELFEHPRAVHAAGTEQTAQAVVAAGGAAATLRPQTDDVRVLRLAHGHDRSFIVVNESDRAIETTATFPASGEPELWDPETGQTAEAGVWREAGRHATAVPLRLEAHETQVVVFRRGGRTPPHAVSSPLPVEQVEDAGRDLRASVRADRPGRFTVVGVRGERLYRGEAVVADRLESVPLDGDWDLRLGETSTRRPLGSWTAIAPGFSGSATYEREIVLDSATLAGRRWTLDLGDVRDVAEVTLNGRDLPPRLWAPYRLDVTGALRPGRNTIHVQVTNTGANARGQARPSGLLGPAALRPERRVDVDLEPVGHARVLEIDAEPVGVAPGQRRTVGVRVRDLAGRSGDARLEASGDGVTVTPSSVDVRLGPDGEGETELAVEAPLEAALPGSAAISLRAGDAERRLPVTVDAATRLGKASASSSYAGRPPELAIDGIVDSTLWDGGQGWNDGTLGGFPDSLTVAFGAPAPIGRMRLHTLDSERYPARAFGIEDADLQLRAGGEWQTVAAIRDNDRGVVDATFTPVTADAARVVVHAARASYSRIIELEALPR
jgi:hypothetical protein